MLSCIVCTKLLVGKQSKFCCKKCKAIYSNNKLQNYKSQKIRGKTRREALIKLKGGKCSICNYDKNTSALCFHHLDSKLKSFELDLRNCSNRTEQKLNDEVQKCILLCHNCHMELHYPEDST